MSLMDSIFNTIAFLDDFYWSNIGWLLITSVGVYLTIISRGLQFRAIINFRQNMRDIISEAQFTSSGGIHPFKLYFASVGGMVGLGNIVGISIAIMIGGPGSIFWIIIASICGTLLKYSEIYLGVKHRVKNNEGGFDGGPMYYLQDAFGNKFLASLAALLICFYGVETYQFLVLVERIEHTFDIDKFTVVLSLLALVIYSTIGGISRLATICTLIMPVFMLSYIILAIYVIFTHADQLYSFFYTVMSSAFTGHAALGGFAGSAMMNSAYLGISKTVYSGDIGIGYDSIVQSETSIVNPQRQATLAIYALFTDTFICLLTNTMIGVTGAWHKLNHIKYSDIVAHIFDLHFPYSDLFVTLLLFFAGFTTLIAYLAAGAKCAKYLSPKYGKIIYLLYAVFAFIFFSNFSQEKLIVVMGLVSGILVLINVAGILMLHKEIEFK